MIWALVGGCGVAPPNDGPIATLSADLTWVLEVDAAAIDAGYTACNYSRHYNGEEDLSIPWLCPECDEVWRSTVALPESERACLAQITPEPPPAVEWLGIGGGQWWRGIENATLDALSEVEDDGETFTVAYQGDWQPFTEGGTASFRLSISGAATRGTGTGDPLHGLSPPERYTCGWPKRHAPPYEGPWVLEVGELLPDGAFLDRCDEAVRLHDFAGRWLVIDIAAMDCGPCQQMAINEAAFMESTDAQVEIVTLLVPTLENVYTPTSRANIDAWAETFDITHPVLRDRGWGTSLGFEAFTLTFGYPMILVVGPDGRIRSQGVGYGGWDAIQDVIDNG